VRRLGRRAWLFAGAGCLTLGLLVAVGCSLLSDGFAPSVATPEMARQALASRWAPLPGGGRVHYVAAGESASPRRVLFVHGSPGTWEAWRIFLTHDDLAGNAALFALDRPGFGGTDRGRAEGSLARQAAALAAVLDQEGGGPAVIAGHSLGGPIAARLALDRPELVSGLLLVAPSIDPESEERRWFNVAGSLRVVQWFLPVDWIASNREIWPLKRELAEIAPRLAEIRAPVVVLQGEKDELVDPANADFVGRAFTGASVEIERFPDLGHFLLWQRPDLVRAALARLLDRPAASRRSETQTLH
jgi:pimeloyl-ACP methyl ester carboxylesterase